MKYLPRLHCALVLSLLSCSDEPKQGPPAPEQLIATGISPTEIKLTWTDVSLDEDGFVIERKFGSQFLIIEQVAGNVSEFLDEKLTPETSYEYRVVSVNVNGKSPTYSNIASAKTTKLPATLQVTTEIISKIGMVSALAQGGFNENADPVVSEFGVVWSTSTGPTTDLETKTSYQGGNYFFSVIGLLEPSQKYYVRAYAKNALGTVYGNELSFTTSSTPFFLPGSGVVDIDGNSYKTIVIGDQEWMAENLRTSTFANGEIIANVTNPEQWNVLTTPAWCHYDNNPQYDNLQGKLYNWYAASNARNVCPNGWHLPKLSEWEQLSDYLGGNPIAGARLTSPLPTWEVQVGISTNESGFSAVHSGLCHPFQNLYTEAIWWTSTLRTSGSPLILTVRPEGVGSRGFVDGFEVPFVLGICVRCIKN